MLMTPAEKTTPPDLSARICRAALPACRTPGFCPWLTMATRSHSFSTSRMMCVEKRMHLPRSRRRSMFCSTARATSTSRPSVGSSKISTGGSWTMARAIDTFCLMPVDMLGAEHVAEIVHLQSRRKASPCACAAVRRSGHRACRSTRPTPRRSCDRRWRCWRRGSRCAGGPGSALGDDVEAGQRSQRRSVGLRTVQRMRMVVVLPAPLGPSRPKISPGLASKETRSTAKTWPRRRSRKDFVRFSTWIMGLTCSRLALAWRHASAKREQEGFGHSEKTISSTS